MEPQDPIALVKIPTNLADEMQQSYMAYAMSVIIGRALPDVRDGLKPANRRVLYGMQQMGLQPGRPYRKSAKIVGEVMGNYHPHGDAAIYDTLARMAQPFNMRAMLVDGQGNFGSVDGDPPAAMRYTEARLTAAATEMLDELPYETVDYVPNYDESRTEPTVLPARFPNLLVNGSLGIAVGMASSVPPHNLGEVAEALVRYIEDPDLSLEALMEVLPGPDFPTGGVICGRQGILDAYTTGRGKLVVRGRVSVEEERNGRYALTVEEIPYPPRRDLIIERIAELVKEGRIDGIARIEDYADRTNPYRIYLQLKKGEDPQVVENQLYKYTPLQETFGVHVIALVDGKPETLPLKDLLRCYRDYRVQVVRRRTKFLLDKAEARAHVVEGLRKALDAIDQVIAVIRASDNQEVAQARLVDRFGFSDRQAEAILRMTLARLTGLERRKLDEELADLRQKIARYREILGSEKKVLEVLVEELRELQAKHRGKRRTEITGEAVDFNREELIAQEDVVVTMSRAGYLKRVPLDTYRTQGRGGRGIIGAETKEEDVITHLFTANTHDTLLFLTTEGRAFAKRVFEVPELSRTSAGRSIQNLLDLRGEERVTSAFAIQEFDDRGLLFATRQGIVKKVTLSLLRNATRQNGILACDLLEGDRLLGAALLQGGEHVILGTANGMAICFPESEARLMGRSARGVRGIKLRAGDAAVGLVVVAQGAALLTVCENGYGKRTLLEEYRPQARGGLGLIDIQTTERNGPVVEIAVVSETDDVVLISAQGMIIRSRAREISVIGRNTQGVRLMNLKPGDKLLAAAVVVGGQGA